MINKILNIRRKMMVIALVVLAGFMFVVILINRQTGRLASPASTAAAASKSAIPLNKEYHFDMKDEKGQTVSTLKYTIESAQLQKSVVVQGQLSSAVAGKTFLVLNLKLVNDYDKPFNINTKDYIRLSVNGDKNEWLAPELYNDPLNVQAISTKYSRLGFIINDTDKNLILAAGEIDGSKDNIKLSF